jgi:hypothetical protein
MMQKSAKNMSYKLTVEKDDLEQYTRRGNVKIFGIKKEENETQEELEDSVIKIAEDMGIHNTDHSSISVSFNTSCHMAPMVHWLI